MHKIVTNKIERMRLQVRDRILLFWGVIAVLGLLIIPSGVHAAIGTTTQNWPATPIYSAAAYPAAGITYNAVAGNNRLLVVGISSSTTAVNQPQPTVTYGGVSMTYAVGTNTTATQQHSYLFYLPIGTAATADTGKTIVVTMSGGTSRYCIVNAAVYTGVDQAAPLGTSVRSSNNTTASTVVGPFTLAVNSGEMGISVLNGVRTGTTAGTARTITIGTTGHLWSQVSTVASSRIVGALRTTFATTLNTNTTTATQHASSNSTLNSTAAITIKPMAGVTVGNGTTVAGNKSVFVDPSSTNIVIDTFTLSATNAMNVTGITFTSNANTISSKISAIRIWRKVGTTLTVWEASDVQVGSATPNGGAVTMTVNEPVTTATKNYIVTYDVATNATAATTTPFTGTITAITPTALSLTDTAALSANLYIYPTTTIGDGVEPPVERLPKSSSAKKLDAFTLVHNSTITTDDDPVTNLTFSLTPPLISGGTGGTSSKIKLMEVVSADGLTVYGSSTAPTTGDNWNIATPTLKATSTLTTYYLRVSTADVIDPSAEDTSGTLTGYYTFGGTITQVTHTNNNNHLDENDNNSQTLIIDVEKPTGPATATATTGTTGGTIDLTWDDASLSDPHAGTLDATTPYLVRRDTTQPLVNCSTGTVVTLSPTNQSSRRVTDTGLIDTAATRYYYRVCAKDAQGNISDGKITEALSKVSNICNTPPTLTLKAMDASDTQIIKSAEKPGSELIYFNLTILNNDIGSCDDVAYAVDLGSEAAAKLSGAFTPDIAHFNKNIDGSAFPKTLTVGTGDGSHAGKVSTAKIYISGKSSANQLEQYLFTIKATNALVAGSPFSSPQVTGLLNDMPPIVHNNSNMGKSQYGNWGQEFTCATCHSNSTTNIKGVYTLISTGKTGRRNVIFTKTSSSATDYDGVYGNDQRPNKNTSNYVCAVCHTRTRQHQYSAIKVVFNTPEGTGVAGRDGNEYYNPDHHNSADCAKCHTHNTAFRSIYGVCGDCHGWKSTQYAPYGAATMVKEITLALGNPAPDGAHKRHNTAKLSCVACHSNTNHGTDAGVWVGDGKIDMGFAINKDTFPGFNALYSFTNGVFNGSNSLNQNPVPFAWNGATGTVINPVPSTSASCNTYCHGQWTGNVGAMTSPDWITPGQAACGTCHNASGTAPPVSGSHAKHAANTGTGLGIACDRCHATYTSYTGSAHINGNVQWKLKNLGTLAAYKGLSSGSTGKPAPTLDYGTYGSCTNLYCHSNVQGADGTGGPTAYATPAPVWGETVACGSCHAEPNTSGSHAAHENELVSFDCHVCHNNGGYTNPLSHANGNIDFQFVGLGANTKYMGGVTSVPAGTAFGTCSNSNCHGNFTRAWGTPPSGLALCDKCHGSATSPRGFYSTRGPDGTLSIYSAGIGVHDIHLQNANSPRKAGFTRFTSFAKGFSCRQCHLTPSGPFTGDHIDTALPAEIPFSHVSSVADNGKKKFSYYTSPTYSFATQSCSAVWCHGAGMNSNNSSGPYEGVAPAINRQNPQWNQPFLTGNPASDCTRCHAMPPPAPDANYIHYGKAMTDCKTCHTHLTNDGYSFKNKSLHINGVIDGGCDKCHGYPPINNIVGDAQGLTTPAQGALQLGTAGAHNAHVQNAGIGKNCQTCHYNYTTAMPSNNLELGFNAMNGAITSGTFTGYSNSGTHPQWVNTNAGTVILKTSIAANANVCSNLYCHGGGTGSLPALGGGSKTNPNWEGGSADAICGTCHGADTTSAPTGGSHDRHALGINGGAGLLCASCHGSSTNMTHVNGAVSWSLDRANPVFGANATYNNTSSGSIAGLAPRNNGSDYRTCDNVYCHSNVQGTDGPGKGAPTAYGSPRWGFDNNKLTCGSCHKNMAIELDAPGSHVKHANTTQGNTNMALSCGYCHQDGGSGSLNHADNMIFVNFTSYVGGTYANNGRTAGSVAGYSSCSATFCHGTAASPAWGTAGPLACNACHGAKADDVSWSGRHKTHYNYSTMPTSYTQTLDKNLSDINKYRFNCAHCHDDNVARHSLMPASANSAARVFFGISSATPATSSKRGLYVAGAAQGATDNGFKFTAGSCNTSYCHSDGRGGVPLNTTLTWITTPTAGSNCLYCHDGKYTTSTASKLSGKHDMHMNPTRNTMIGTGNGFNCVDCHAQVITNSNNITLANKGKHVNALVDYSGARANKGLNKTTGNGECTNVYCHSNGNKGAVVFVSMTGSKNWNTTTYTITSCNKCHGRSNSIGYPDYANGWPTNQATANLHSGHLAGMTDTLACADCHRRTVDSGVVNKFRAYTTTHLSSGPNVDFNTTKNYIGAKATVNTVGYQVTCSNIVCHGQGAPVWGSQPSGGAGVRTCTKCHGTRTATDYLTNYSSAIIAPGYNGEGTDTSMTKAAATDARVGAHQRHLVSNVISTAVKCGECHVTVTAIRSANHWNYSTATLTFGGRATANAHTPSVTRVSGIIQCSNTNCHGGKYNSGSTIAPFWNMTGMVKESANRVDAACTKCHAMPPTAYSGHSGYTVNASDTMAQVATVCGGCHNNLKSGATGVADAFYDKTKHVNGTINYVANCDGCHAYDLTGGGTTWTPVLSGGTGTGAHIKHIAFIKSRLSIVSLTPAGQTFGTGEPAAVCGTCHTNTLSEHDNGSRQITFGAGGTANTMGAGYSGSMSLLFGGTNPAYSSGAKSCSNLSCHYFITPSWY